MAISIKELGEQMTNEFSLLDRKFEIMEGKIEGFNTKLDQITNNHLAHLKEQVTQNSNDIDWIKKIQWAGLGIGVGSLVTIVTALITNSI